MVTPYNYGSKCRNKTAQKDGQSLLCTKVEYVKSSKEEEIVMNNFGCQWSHVMTFLNEDKLNAWDLNNSGSKYKKLSNMDDKSWLCTKVEYVKSSKEEEIVMNKFRRQWSHVMTFLNKKQDL